MAASDDAISAGIETVGGRSGLTRFRSSRRMCHPGFVHIAELTPQAPLLTRRLHVDLLRIVSAACPAVV